MRNLITFYLIIILFASCCTKKDCLSAFDINEIRLINFEAEEVDSIFLKSYVKNSNFTDEIDSAYVTSIREVNDSDEFVLLMPFPFEPANDYRIEFRKSDFVIEMADIKTESKKCNTCFLAKDNYSVLESYQVNGVLNTNQYIEIIK
ncbi:MAG: hypothetical protein ACPG5B_07060 [Chitinophagales bacterium]